MLEDDGFDVSDEVIHGDDGPIERRGQRLRKRDADQQRSHETRSLRHGQGVDVAPTPAAVLQRALGDTADVANVLARRDLRHHAAPLPMNLDLRRDDVRQDTPRLRRITRRRDEGRGGLVTGCLNAKDVHGYPAATGSNRALRLARAALEQCRVR